MGTAEFVVISEPGKAEGFVSSLLTYWAHFGFVGLLQVAQAITMLPPFQGSWTAIGQVIPFGVIKVVEVYSMSPATDETVSLLSEDNYTCVVPKGTPVYRCTRFFGLDDLSQDARKLIFDETSNETSIVVEGLQVRFYEPPTITQNFGTQWQIPQKVVFRGKSYAGYTFASGPTQPNSAQGDLVKFYHSAFALGANPANNPAGHPTISPMNSDLFSKGGALSVILTGPAIPQPQAVSPPVNSASVIPVGLAALARVRE